MAKDTKHSDPPAPYESHSAPPPAGKATPSGSTWTVTFPGLPPITVEAPSAEEAISVAAEKQGVVRSETKPEVVPG